MADAKREAKLSLKFENADAVRGMKEVRKEAEGIAAAQKEIRAETEKANASMASAAKIMERYGPGELSKPERRRLWAAERAFDRDAARMAQEREDRARADRREKTQRDNDSLMDNYRRQKRDDEARLAGQRKAAEA